MEQFVLRARTLNMAQPPSPPRIIASAQSALMRPCEAPAAIAAALGYVRLSLHRRRGSTGAREANRTHARRLLRDFADCPCFPRQATDTRR
ncbi:hypothetical protein AcV5_003827 [Taiwanofungus camphoratus]|nr:hypothetical protein AcV5_003827 [Antrodia cinnamomea]